MEIKFKFSAHKAAAAIQRIVCAHPNIDLHAALKAFYFADKSHLNEHHLPIFGAQYRAMKFGPVPLEIYEMMKGESYWLAELRQIEYPWIISGYHLGNNGNNSINFDEKALAPSNLAHLDAGVERSMGMDFGERTAATHGPDWQAANMGIISYADMIEEGPNKEKAVAYLLENGPRIRL